MIYSRSVIKLRKISCLLLVSFFVCFIGMIPVHAGSFNLQISGSSSIVLGETASYNVDLTNNNEGITNVKATITYDKAKLTFDKVRGINGWTATSKNGKNGIEISASATNSSTPDVTAIYNITFKVNEKAKLNPTTLSIIDITGNGSISGNGTSISSTLVQSISANNYLKSLSVGGSKLVPEFDKGVSEYSTSVSSDTEKISINATPADKNAKVIEGTGSYNLDYGNNVIYVRVRANSGEIREYKLNINRADPRSNNNSLRFIDISSGNLSPKFNPNILEYYVDVSGDTEALSIKAATVDSNAKIVGGTGDILLQPGNNNVHINVQSERGIIKTYLLKVNRDDGRSANDFLSVLDGGKWVIGPSFDKNITNYTMIIPNDITSITLDARAEHSGATVQVTGADNLKEGDNTVTITVTAQNGGVKVYRVNVRRATAGASSDVTMKSIYIKGVNKKIHLKDKIVDYNIETYKGIDNLSVQAVPEQSTTSIKTEIKKVTDNPNQKVITVTPIAEDGTNMTYTITILHKDIPIWLWVILIILIIGIIYIIYKFTKTKLEEAKKKKVPVRENIYYNDDPNLYIPEQNNNNNMNQF